MVTGVRGAEELGKVFEGNFVVIGINSSGDSPGREESTREIDVTNEPEFDRPFSFDNLSFELESTGSVEILRARCLSL